MDWRARSTSLIWVISDLMVLTALVELNSIYWISISAAKDRADSAFTSTLKKEKKHAYRQQTKHFLKQTITSDMV